MSHRASPIRDSLLADYCFVKGLPFEPSRFTVTDAELLSWVNEPSIEDDAKLVLRDLERARAGDHDAQRVLEATGFGHLISEEA